MTEAEIDRLYEYADQYRKGMSSWWVMSFTLRLITAYRDLVHCPDCGQSLDHTCPICPQIGEGKREIG